MCADLGGVFPLTCRLKDSRLSGDPQYGRAPIAWAPIAPALEKLAAPCHLRVRRVADLQPGRRHAVGFVLAISPLGDDALKAGRMTESYRERVLHFLSVAQSQLAKFARESYALDGRGLIQVAIPEPPPGLGGLAMTDMRYHKLEDLRELLKDVGDANREDADITLRMVETYDPERQAVVTVAADGENPISVKLRLESLTIIESDTAK